MSKIITSVALAGLVALSLVACSAPAANDCMATQSGPNSSKVTVDGAFGTEPSVKIPSPFDAKETERTVTITGEGSEFAVDGMVVNANFVVYNASTGDKFEATEYTNEAATPFLIDEAKSFPGIYKALHCSSVGERIIAIIPPVDMFGADGPNFGVGATDSLVFVFDITKVEPAPTQTPSAAPAVPPLDKADGEAQPPQDGFPTVVLADNGTPTVTIPDAAPPTDLKIAVLKKGSGAVVPEGATVVVHYTGLNWTTHGVFDSSWSRGTPSSFGTGGVIPGFAAAIVGQTVGSQVVVIIPPDQGYGPQGGNPDAGISATDVLVFIVDILGIA